MFYLYHCETEGQRRKKKNKKKRRDRLTDKINKENQIYSVE